MKKLPQGALSWAFYDWANSAFALTILAGFFGPFFKSYWTDGSSAALSWQGYTVSLASLIAALLAPFLGALADHGKARKRFLTFFMLVGSLASAGLALIKMGQWRLACVVYIIASIGFYCGNIFYDSLLPNVSSERNRHYVSGLGFSIGYFGSVLLFCLQVLAVIKPDLVGLPDSAAAIKLSFLSVAFWWILFSIPLLKNVPESEANSMEVTRMAIGESLNELKKTVSEIATRRPVILWFLLAYWFYIDGAYTLITMSTGYGAALGFSQTDLMGTLILVQFVGVPCALLFGWAGQRFGPRLFIFIAIVIYLGVTLFSSRLDVEPRMFFGKPVSEIYVLGLLIGLVQGGLQSLSRSLYITLIPVEKAAAYFGLYNMVGKGAAILGPALLALTVQFTGSARAGPLAISLLFLLGASFLLKVKTVAQPNSLE